MEVTGVSPPIFVDDDDSVTPEYSPGLIYSEILYSPIEVDLKLFVELNRKLPSLSDNELHFVDIAIRKLLMDNMFDVWKVEVESHSISEVEVHPFLKNLFQCNYLGIFTVGLRVNRYETDVLGLKSEMHTSLLTAMNTGKFKKVLNDAFRIHRTAPQDYSRGDKVEGFLFKSIDVYNDEYKVSTIPYSDTPYTPEDSLYFDFLQSNEDIKSGASTSYVEHRFTHVYVGLTVFALTILFLFLSYGCFMSRACRRAKKIKNVLPLPGVRGRNPLTNAVKTTTPQEVDDTECVSIIFKSGEEAGTKGLYTEIDVADQGANIKNNSYGDKDTIAF